MISSSAGFRRKEFRGKLAIAITANFINRNTTAEAKVEEISGVAFIFNQKFFQDLREATGQSKKQNKTSFFSLLFSHSKDKDECAKTKDEYILTVKTQFFTAFLYQLQFTVTSPDSFLDPVSQKPFSLMTWKCIIFAFLLFEQDCKTF